MNSGDNRREFLQKIGAISLVAGTAGVLSACNNSQTNGREPVFVLPGLRSLPPSELFTVLDLNLPGLSPIREVLEQDGYEAALTELLAYYRERFSEPEIPRSTGSAAEERAIERSEMMANHIFQRDPWDAADYGPDIDWAADPARDIEWVAQINRLYWTRDLNAAYRATGDDRYVEILVDLMTDWFEKHPLEETLEKIHPVYDYWKGYVWLDIETGRRSNSICTFFRLMVHSPAFTPEFMARVLASLYDHNQKTEKIPMGHVHNKAIFEQRGLVEVIYTFPEYKEKDKWLDLAMKRSYEMLIAQTTLDGVQREYSGGYHNGVYRDAISIDRQLQEMGRQMPGTFHERTRKMADYTFGISTPDLAFPMFGDASRGKVTSDDRSTWSLYRHLHDASDRWNDPKYAALADLDLRNLPDNGSTAFPEGGMYALRSRWSPDQVYLALHCSPPPISSHDQPDNGTFELYAYGRWLMPDSGYYVYGLDPEAREWHRQSRVHATLTADGQDTAIQGRHLLWDSNRNRDILCVENQSYQYLAHRRTVWFADKQGNLPFFVILDEAIGTAPNPDAPSPFTEGIGGFDPVFRGERESTLELNFPMAPGGRVRIDQQAQRWTTDFDDANLLIQVAGREAMTIREEQGWHAWAYLQREERPSVTASWKPAGPEEQGPCSFISILLPYQGQSVPDCRLITDPADLVAGSNVAEIEVEIGGRRHQLRREL